MRFAVLAASSSSLVTLADYSKNMSSGERTYVAFLTARKH